MNFCLDVIFQILFTFTIILTAKQCSSFGGSKPKQPPRKPAASPATSPATSPASALSPTPAAPRASVLIPPRNKRKRPAGKPNEKNFDDLDKERKKKSLSPISPKGRSKRIEMPKQFLSKGDDPLSPPKDADIDSKNDTGRTNETKETVEVEPKDLYFEAQTTSQLRLRIKNITCKTVMIKIKTMDVEFIKVNPVFIELPGNELIDTVVTRKTAPAGENKIFVAALPADQCTEDVEKAFKDTNKADLFEVPVNIVGR